jgi:hypothetical protein
MNRILLVGILAGIAAILHNQLKQLKQSKMANEILQELQAKIAEGATRLDNIAADITTIKENPPAEGGLTAEEVSQLRVDLDGLVTKAANLDEENPAPPTEEPPVAE